MKTDNIFDIKPDAGREVTDILLRSEALRVERIVSSGQSSPPGFWYDQDENEYVVLVRGEAMIGFEDETVRLGEGDTLLIPAHRRHRVDYTQKEPPCIWLCCFYKN